MKMQVPSRKRRDGTCATKPSRIVGSGFFKRPPAFGAAICFLDLGLNWVSSLGWPINNRTIKKISVAPPASGHNSADADGVDRRGCHVQNFFPALVNRSRRSENRTVQMLLHRDSRPSCPGGRYSPHLLGKEWAIVMRRRALPASEHPGGIIALGVAIGEIVEIDCAIVSTGESAAQSISCLVLMHFGPVRHGASHLAYFAGRNCSV